MTYCKYSSPFLVAKVHSCLEVCCEEPGTSRSWVSAAQRPTSQPLFREQAGSAPGFKRSQQASAWLTGTSCHLGKIRTRLRFHHFSKGGCAITVVQKEKKRKKYNKNTKYRGREQRTSKVFVFTTRPERGLNHHTFKKRPRNKLLMQIYFTLVWFPFLAGLQTLPTNTIYQTQNIVRKKGTLKLNKTWRRFSLN